MVSSALLGGLFIGILSALPIVNVANCCCLWIVGGGVVAAYLLQQEQSTRVTLGKGAGVGVLAGLVGAFVWLFAALALNVIVAPLQDRMADTMISLAQDMPPEARAWLEGIGTRASSPVSYVLGLLVFAVIGPFFSMLGGMLGALYFGRDSSGGIVPPPLPPL